MKVRGKSAIKLLLLFALYPPVLLDRMGELWGTVENDIRVFFFAFLMVRFIIKRKEKFGKYEMFLLAFLVYTFFRNILISFEVALNGIKYIIFPILFSYLSVIYIFEDIEKDKVLLNLYFPILIWINALLMLLYPYGVIQSREGASSLRANWLFGSKNNVVDYLPIVMCFLLLFSQKRNYANIKRILTITAYIITSFSTASYRIEFLQGSSTAIMMILIFAVILIQQWIDLRMFFSKISFFVIALLDMIISWVIIAVSIVGVHIGIITNIANAFGKDITFSFRNFIWEEVLAYFFKNVVCGVGEKYYIFGYTAYTYNFWLEQFFRYGIVGAVLLLLVIKNIKKSDSEGTEELIIKVSIISLFVGGLMDEISFGNLFFLLTLYDCFAHRRVDDILLMDSAYVGTKHINKSVRHENIGA